MTVQDTQMVCDQKNFENHCLVETNLLQLFTHPQHSEWCAILSVIIYEVNIVA